MRGALAAVVLVAVLRVEDASACSCMAPQMALVTPGREDAPLGTKIRLQVPNNATPTAVVRVGGATVAATQRTWGLGGLTWLELTPTRPLAPSTTYEVAVVDAAAFPSTTVLAAFTTGTASDTAAPKIATFGAAAARGGAHAGGGTCSIKGPWIEIPNVKAEDPGRPGAKLGFVLWSGDDQGHVDTSRPFEAFLTPYEGRLTIGQSSLCDPHEFFIPKAPQFTFAVAAVDESGNQSPPRKLRVSLAGHP